ncbi:unnamed protein product [Echinostoma caproni]|uniref:Uncharacterized protein n=1 Tax=Echinostoma caproni TaxID=27848 RepID=A0A183B8R5_9TREM|nr:unnamed protein product [Echinostoma caproni]
MVHKDRHKQSDELQPEAVLVTTCGCPNNCEAELRKLRDYVNSFQPLLSNEGDLPTLYQLDHFATSPVSLLSEAWVTLGPSHLRDLVSSELLAICARREQRDRDQCLSNRDEKDRTNEYMNTPPFLSLEAENSCVITAGVKELWKRSLRELNDLSESEIKAVLSGTLGDFSKSPAKAANSNHAPNESDKSNSSSNWPCVSNENFDLSETNPVSILNEKCTFGRRNFFVVRVRNNNYRSMLCCVENFFLYCFICDSNFQFSLCITSLTER